MTRLVLVAVAATLAVAGPAPAQCYQAYSVSPYAGYSYYQSGHHWHGSYYPAGYYRRHAAGYWERYGHAGAYHGESYSEPAYYKKEPPSREYDLVDAIIARGKKKDGGAAGGSLEEELVRLVAAHQKRQAEAEKFEAVASLIAPKPAPPSATLSDQDVRVLRALIDATIKRADKPPAQQKE